MWTRRGREWQLALSRQLLSLSLLTQLAPASPAPDQIPIPRYRTSSGPYLIDLNVYCEHIKVVEAELSLSQIPVLRNLRSPRSIAAHVSPEREKTCLVDSHGDLTTDNSEYVISALEECNDGGRAYPTSGVEILGTDSL